MTIAEALTEVKHTQDQINKAKAEFGDNCVQINNHPVEKKPAPILNRVLMLIDTKAKLETNLQYSNATVKIENGMTLLSAMNRRKYLKQLVESTEAMLATMKNNKRSQGYGKDMDVRTYIIEPDAVRSPLDSAAKELRQLEAMIQKCNYTADLLTA